MKKILLRDVQPVGLVAKINRPIKILRLCPARHAENLVSWLKLIRYSIAFFRACTWSVYAIASSLGIFHGLTKQAKKWKGNGTRDHTPQNPISYLLSPMTRLCYRS